MLEDALREALAREAAGSPTLSSDEIVGQVIRRAVRLRRRQRAGGALLAVILIAVVGLSAVYLPDRRATDQLAGPGGSSPAPAPALITVVPGAAAGISSPVRGEDVPDRPRAQAQARVARLPADVVADDRLVTVDGGSIDLSFAGTVSEAYRVGESWLILGTPEGAERSALWYVTIGDRPRAVLSGMDGIAIGPDGRRLAWRTGSQLYVGAVVGGQLVNKRHTPVLDTATPVGFVGGAVLLARTGAAGRSGGYDVWWPSRGEYEPAWDNTAAVVYGTLSDGRTVVAQVSAPVDAVDKAAAEGTAAASRRWCLALLDAARALTMVKSVCGLGLGARARGWISPDGRWLVTDAANRTVLVDLHTAFAGAPRLVGVGPAMRGGAAWTDKTTVVHATSSGRALVRLQVDRAARSQADQTEQFTVPVPDLPANAPVLVVPRLA